MYVGGDLKGEKGGLGVLGSFLMVTDSLID